MFQELLTALIAVCGGPLAFFFYKAYISPRHDPLWTLCGPPCRSIFDSHMRMILEWVAFGLTPCP
jgi:hypothetical protein